MIPNSKEDVENMSPEEAAMSVQELKNMSERILLTRYTMGEHEFTARLGTNLAEGEIELKVTMEITKGADLVEATFKQAKREIDEFFGTKNDWRL